MAANVTGPLFMADQVNAGQTPDYDDLLIAVQAPLYKLASWIKRGRKPQQIESIHYLEPAETTTARGRREGEDVAGYSKSTPVEFKARGQFFGGEKSRASWMVSDQADVMKVIGRDGKKERAYQMGKALERLKKAMEFRFASALDAQAEGVSGATYNGTAGIWAYARTGATGYHVIPEGFRPTSSQVVSGANLTDFTYAALESGLLALWDIRHEHSMLTGFVAPKMKRKFANFLNYQPTAPSGTVSVKTVNVNADAATAIYTPVQRLEHDYATIDLVDYPWHLHTEGTDEVPSAAQAASSRSGCFLTREAWDIGMYNSTTHKDLPDNGGGPRGAWFNACMLRALMPCWNLWFQYAAD